MGCSTGIMLVFYLLQGYRKIENWCSCSILIDLTYSKWIWKKKGYPGLQKELQVGCGQIKEDGQVSLKHILKGHQKPVLTVSWNPDDTELLTCGREGIIRRWDTSSGECIHVYEKAAVGLVSCGWVPDGVGIFVGMTDKSIC
ncbi:hypothetical protein GH714_037016 [Hevea brasiliensis]|uniref:Uncharacterized protein n=1 Tax=Hevea brasiliensis TaxID=3981 RepID=A0A6A6MJT3_HEVBR|nr:hypothetical protein GH714_037016 [Hevea brasiliensis]